MERGRAITSSGAGHVNFWTPPSIIARAEGRQARQVQPSPT